MKLGKMKKELQVLVATIESRDSDTERLHALERVFEICNLCSTRSELRAFHDVVPPRRIPHLAKLAVDKSRKGQKSGTAALSPSAERLLQELDVWARGYDPGPDLAAAAIRRGDEKEIMPIIEAIVAELGCETMSTRAWLAANLKQPGRGRIGALGDIVVRRRGSEMAQSYARALLHAVLCVECSTDQIQVACRCGCRRRLCERCAETDDVTKMILAELAVSS